MSQQKVLLVGAGRMGKNHLRVLRELPKLFSVVGVVDHAAKPGPEHAEIPFYDSLDAVKASFDVAVVATPTFTHASIGHTLIDAGKHLLMEKPIASSFTEGRELLDHAEKKGVRLAVGHVERFNPAVRKLREVLKGGLLGTPIHFSFTRVGGYPITLLKGNNVILDLAVHDIDVLRSMGGAIRFEGSLCHSTWKEGVIDTAEIYCSTHSGASASMHVNWITPTKIRSVRVTGTKGVCFVDYILQTVELFGGNLLSHIEPSLGEFEAFVDLYRTTDKIAFGVQKEEPLRAQAEQFHRFITTGEPGDLSLGSDALAAVLVAERATATQSRPTKQIERTSAPPPSLHDEWV